MIAISPLLFGETSVFNIGECQCHIRPYGCVPLRPLTHSLSFSFPISSFSFFFCSLSLSLNPFLSEVSLVCHLSLFSSLFQTLIFPVFKTKSADVVLSPHFQLIIAESLVASGDARKMREKLNKSGRREGAGLT